MKKDEAGIPSGTRHEPHLRIAGEPPITGMHAHASPYVTLGGAPGDDNKMVPFQAGSRPAWEGAPQDSILNPK